MVVNRNYRDPAYKQWRITVYKRDGFRCRWCGKRGRLNAHHIRRWAEFPELRFSINNGITLCRDCHEKVKGQEEYYAELFIRLISDMSSAQAWAKVQMLIRQDNDEVQGSS